MSEKAVADDQDGQAHAGLRLRMATGAVWMVGLRFAIRGIGMLSTLLTAPLLTPADFGLVALATTFATLLEITTDFSVDVALIRDRNAGRPEYDTAWTMNLIKAVLVALVLVATAVPSARFFGDPRLASIMYWLAGMSALGGFINIGIVDFRRDLEIGKEFTLQFWAKMSSSLLTVALAFWWHTYWSLVAGIVLRRVIVLLLSYTMSPYRPRFCLQRWRELVFISKWLLANNFLLFVRERVDTLILGKLIGAGPLGLYTVGLEIADLPTTELAAPVSRAVFPGYARLAGDRDKLARNYVDTFASMMLVSMPAAVGIGLAADPLIRVWLGTAWLTAVPLIQALIVFGLCRTAYGNAGAIYMALGRVRIEPATMLVYIALLVPLLYWLVPTLGVMGAAYALTGAAASNLVLNKLILMRLLDLKLSTMLAPVWRTVAATLVMILLVKAFPAPMEADLARLGWTALLGSSSFVVTLTILCQLSGWPAGPERQLWGYGSHALRRWYPLSAEPTR